MCVVVILGTKKSSVLLEWVFLRYVAGLRLWLKSKELGAALPGEQLRMKDMAANRT